MVQVSETPGAYPRFSAGWRRLATDWREQAATKSADRIETAGSTAKSTAWHLKYSRALILADAVAIIIAISVAQWFRFHAWLEPSDNIVTKPGFSVALFVLWMAGLGIGHSRLPRVIGTGSEEYRQVARATFLVFGTVGLLSVLIKVQLSRSYLLIVLPLGIFLLLLLRWTARKIISRVRERTGRCVTRLVVVGNLRAVRELSASLSRVPASEYRVVGVCVAGRAAQRQISIPGLGPVRNFGSDANIGEALRRTGGEAVAVTATKRLVGSGLAELSWELEKLDVELLVAPGLIDVTGQRLHMRPMSALPLIQVEKPQYLGAKQLKKGFYDVAFSSLVLLCGLPVLALIALAVKLTSRGPVIYRQERIGMDGKPFQMLKFRTMVEGADRLITDLTDIDLVASPRDPFKFRNDPRVTPVGRFLRKYSLDELPQFVNVLKRDMSVVGPRPQVAGEVSAYDDQAKRRLLVRPGITGLWQVNGRSDLSWEDSVRLDTFYVENWSVTADIFIGLKTIKAILRPNGAY